MPVDEPIERIALLNFGGIGDEILFSPVIHALREAYPDAHLTLILEDRSRRIKELLPELDATVEIDIQQHSRLGLFFKLFKILRGRHFDAVISSGSSPFIAVLLFLSGIPLRVGFDSGAFSQNLLTGAAPLDRKAYAGEMYFSLARTFLKLAKPDFPTDYPAIPHLVVGENVRQKALQILKEAGSGGEEQRIFIHPGVSQMSIVKNILKAWPVKYWEALLAALPAKYPDAHIYLLGGPDDAAVIQALEAYRQTMPVSDQSRIFNLYGKTTTLRDLAALIDCGDVLVSVDSAPMHLAIGLQTPVVALFSPTDPKKLVPIHEGIEIAAVENLPCRPCLWDIRKTSCDKPDCLDIPVDLVMAKIEKVLQLDRPKLRLVKTPAEAPLPQMEYEI